MRAEYKIGQIVNIHGQVELDSGVHEDARPYIYDNGVRVRIVGPFNEGAFQVQIVGSEDIWPVFWHQPVKRP